MTPVEPLKNAMGRNTADSTSAMPTRAPVISPIELARRLLRRELLFVHDTLDVLDDDDGIVDQQTDRQHHAEHGERVDRVSGSRQYAECAEQHHGHRDRRNERGAEILQEEVHDEEHQDDRLEQRLHDLIDRDAHERRGVVGIDELQAGREERRQLVHRGVYRFGRLERIGAWCELDGEARRRMAVVLGVDRVAFGAQARCAPRR